MTFFRKNVFYLPPFQSTYDDIIKCYTARGGTTMNYAKKVVTFITMHVFYQEYLIRRLHKIFTLCAFIFFIFGHQVET